MAPSDTPRRKARFDNTDPQPTHEPDSPPRSDVARVYEPSQSLPEPLPADPMPTVKAWFDRAHAQRVQPNPNAMTLATVGGDGRPSARIVLCKKLDTTRGLAIFYTNTQSRKATDISATGRVAVVMHWDTLDLQVRIEGPIVPSPDEESDAYYASRPLASRIGAWSSQQSRPAASRGQLLDQVWQTCERFGITPHDLERDPEPQIEIQRPPFWGGYRIWAERVELWAAGPGRLHDRGVWTRSLAPSGPHDFAPGEWANQRLQP